jgi:molybdopterin-containing oxidoreductase family iron-sulfur binding subunit
MATLLASKLTAIALSEAQGMLSPVPGIAAGGNFAAISDPNVDAWITEVANDLTKAKGRSLVVCGSQQPAIVHALVDQINQSLGNVGQTVKLAPVFLQSAATISELSEQISQGTVKTLLVLGGNPVFNTPADLGFDGVITQVEQVIRLGLHVDETSAASTTHIPAAHFLESWGDSLAYDGTYLSQQPLILPLYGGISELDLLAELASQPKAKGAEHVQKTFAQSMVIEDNKPDVFDDVWRQFVHDGFTSHAVSFVLGQESGAPESTAPQQLSKPLQPGEYELNFVLGMVDDGRHANNGWLQELPDPVSKLTWDNALYLSPKTAALLGIVITSANDNALDLPNTDVAPRASTFPIPHVDPMTAFPMVKVTTPDGRSMELPVLVAPGQADATLTIALGWGRTGVRLTDEAKKDVTAPLRVADGAGFNAYQLRTSATPGFVTGVKIEKIEKTYPLAITQEHNSMEGRSTSIMTTRPSCRRSAGTRKFRRARSRATRITSRGTRVRCSTPRPTSRTARPGGW